MSLMAHTVYHVECNTEGCKEGTPDFEAIHEAKSFMADEGWTGDTFNSFCPDCSKKEGASAKSEQVQEVEAPQEPDEEDQPTKKGGKDGKADRDAKKGLASKS